MTTRTLFNFFLKILGIFYVRDVLLDVFIQSMNGIIHISFWPLIITILIVILNCFIPYLLLFKTDLITDRLKLTKGFNYEIFPLNLSQSDILSISIIFIGGFLVADEIPILSWQLLNDFQIHASFGNKYPLVSSFLILQAVKIAIGLFLMIEQKRIVNYIDFKRKRDLRA